MANIVLIVVFFACFAFLFNGGLWSNTLTLVNVVTAALFATNYFEPLANWFDLQEPSGHYFYDFLALWILFAVAFTVMRVLTDFVSKVRVRFFLPVEKAGGILMAIWVSWILMCFTTVTLHTAPLSRNFMGFQAEPNTKMLFGLGPDRVWLGWVHRESAGSLSRFGGTVPFDRNGDFILRYGERREEFEDLKTLTKPKR
jgi:hypothetical protein